MSATDCEDFLPIPAGLPGATGAPGTTGATGDTGPSGASAYTTLSASFAMPALEASIQIQVASTAWMAAGLHLFIAAGGYFTVVSVDSSTLVTVTPQDVSTNVAESTTITLGGVISPAGVAFLDTAITDALDGRITAIESASGGSTSYYSATAPSGPGLLAGDVWFDSDDGFRIYRWSGASWVDVQRVLELDDFGTGIRPVGIGTSFPLSPTTGDFFHRTDENKLYRWDGSSWDASVPAGELTGEVDGGLLAANSIVSGKIAAGAISATHVGTNLLIADAANIGDAIITSAHISSIDAGKINTGNLTAVNISHTGRLFNVADDTKFFRAVELGTAFNASFTFTAATLFTFGHHTSLKAYGPTNASWGTSGTIKMSPDDAGSIRVQIQGRLLGYTGVICVYYRIDGGTYLPLASRVSSDGDDAIVDAIRQIDGVSNDSLVEFYVAPCDADGDSILTTCRYELDVAVFNW